MKPFSFLAATLQAAAFSAVLLISACSKEADPKPTPAPQPTKTELLTAHSWRSSTRSLIINNVEGIRTLPATEISTLTFKADGTLTRKSFSTGAESSTTWKLQNNDTELVIPGGNGLPQTYKIFELSASKLSYGYDFAPDYIHQGGTYITYLLNSANTYTFPANTTIPSLQQITSMQEKLTLL